MGNRVASPNRGSRGDQLNRQAPEHDARTDELAETSMTVPSVPRPQDLPADRRLGHEPPSAIAKRGWRYHHMGVPTDVERPGETHLAEHGLYVSGYSTSPYGVEWMRFQTS